MRLLYIYQNADVFILTSKNSRHIDRTGRQENTEGSGKGRESGYKMEVGGGGMTF